MGGQGLEVEAPGSSQREHQFLVVEVCGGEFFGLIYRAAMLNSGHVGIEVIGIPLTRGSVIGMGSGSYSEVRGSVPIAAVVTGMETRTAEIGYFIVFKA